MKPLEAKAYALSDEGKALAKEIEKDVHEPLAEEFLKDFFMKQLAIQNLHIEKYIESYLQYNPTVNITDLCLCTSNRFEKGQIIHSFWLEPKKDRPPVVIPSDE